MQAGGRHPGLLLLTAALLAFPALAQGGDLPLDIPLEGVPQKPTKKAAPKKRTEKPAEKAAGQGLEPPPAPGVVDIEPPPPLVTAPGAGLDGTLKLSEQYAVAVLRSAALDDATALEMEAGLRGVAELAPLSHAPQVVQTQCDEDDAACLLSISSRQKVDTLVVAAASRTPAGLTLRLHRLDLGAHKQVGQSALSGLRADRTELKAAAEALFCRLAVPAGCTGELLLDAGGAEVLADDQPVAAAAPGHYRLPVGLLTLRARQGGRSGPTRQVAVLREAPAGTWSVRASEAGPALLAPGERAPAPVAAAPVAAAPLVAAAPAPAPAPAAAPSSPKASAAPPSALAADRSPPAPTRWTRTAGLVAAGVGVLALAIGGYEGMHSKSLLNDAATSFHSNGGAYSQADLANVSSGNSAASTANLLFIVGGVLTAAGGTLAFAF